MLQVYNEYGQLIKNCNTLSERVSQYILYSIEKSDFNFQVIRFFLYIQNILYVLKLICTEIFVLNFWHMCINLTYCRCVISIILVEYSYIIYF